ncbi:caspase domain-containing protein [Cladorrhinum sp. PSN259]|nr:caspase domain-containing protein [Cladorrhinum sp. PSN259]
MAGEQNTAKKSALLIGINDYNVPGKTNDMNLRGAVYDVTVTESFLINIAGFKQENITKLISATRPNDRLPTLTNIVSAFEDLALHAEQGDFIYIHYSGHGGRLPTSFRSLKGDNVTHDECLLIARNDNTVDHLLDVEVAYLLKQIVDKGATVTFVLDCCHSGGATRNGDDDNGRSVRGCGNISAEDFVNLNRELIGDPKNLEEAWSRPPPGDGADSSRAGKVLDHWMTASKGINFLAACRSDEEAEEVPGEKQGKKGVFTDCLASVIKKSGGADRLAQLSCDVVYNLASNELEKHPLRDSSKSQHVVFGGQRDRHIFGVEDVEPPRVTITKTEKLASEKVKVVMNVGAAHGVSADDVFAIYPVGKRLETLADYNAPLATCIVSPGTVENFTCSAITESKDVGLNHLRIGCPAVSLQEILKDHVLDSKGAWVVSSAPDSIDLRDARATVQKVEDCIRYGGKLVQLKESEGEAFFKVLVQRNNSFVISFTPNHEEAKIQVVGDAKDVLSHLIHLTIFYNFFNLATNNPEQQSGLKVDKTGYLEQGVKAPSLKEPFPLDDPPPKRSDLKPLPPNTIDLFHGQTLEIQVRNTTTEPLYIEILDLDPYWTVTTQYPRPSGSPIQLPAGNGVYFYIQLSQSFKPPDLNADQPDTFDRFIVLGTPRNRRNFPAMILPDLGKILKPVLTPDNGGGFRAGAGVDPPSWFVHHLDVRVVAEE